MQEIIEKQIQENLDISRLDEKTYLNEPVACWLHFAGYKYDRLIIKLVDVDVF